MPCDSETLFASTCEKAVKILDVYQTELLFIKV